MQCPPTKRGKGIFFRVRPTTTETPHFRRPISDAPPNNQQPSPPISDAPPSNQPSSPISDARMQISYLDPRARRLPATPAPLLFLRAFVGTGIAINK